MFDNDGMKQIVSAAVVAALNEQAPKLLAELVDRALSKEVNQYGGKPSYGDDKMTLLEQMAGQQLDILIGQAVREWFLGRADEIKAAVTSKLVEGDVASSYMRAMERTLEHARITFDVKVDREA